MHPYEMRRLMALRNKDARLELKPGSLYNAATWLLDQRLIAVADSDQQGGRPKRTTYQITAAGRAVLATWVTEMLATPKRDTSSFSVALDHLVYVSPRLATLALDRRKAALAEAITIMAKSLETLRPRIGRINLIEVEHDLVLARAELKWIDTLLTELASGQLEWNTEQILRAVRKPETSTKAAAAARANPRTRPRPSDR